MSGSRYRILRRLGQGGMAEVFEAELAGELGFVRKVAIKRMLERAAADPDCARRFLDEARIASRLHHANIVAVLDLGLLEGLPFQVLELVDGIDGEQLLQRAGGALPLDVVLAIGVAVAHALDHAHAARDDAGLPLGIVHRDVKPSNVLVAWSGDVKLGDFGIAVAHDRSARTEAGAVAGTRGFIAPEQRARSQVDGRTDVFALALTLHALATGDTPLRDVETEARLLAGEPVPLAPALPAGVRDLLGRAAAPSRTDRPSAAQLAASLAGLLDRDPRACVRDFLATLERRATAGGALDALLGIELVPTEDRGDVRRYETRVAKPAVGDAGPRGGDDPPPAPDGAGPEPATPPARRAGPIAAAVGGLALAGALVAWQWPASDPPNEPPNEPVARVTSGIDAAAAGSAPRATPELDAAAIGSTASAAPDASSPVEPAAADAAAREPDRIASGSAEAARSTAAFRAPRARVRPAPGSARAPQPPRRVDATAGPDPAPAPAVGYLQVLGEDVVGARVFVDGKLAGSALYKLAVALGTHRIEVERADGTRLPPQTIEVRPVHTRASPLRPRW